MGVKNKNELLSALRGAASNEKSVLGLADFLEKNGEDIRLIDVTDEPLPTITKEEFFKKRGPAREMLNKLGLSDEMPNTWDELEKFIEEISSSEYRIKRYRLDLPEDWDLNKIALVAVSKDASSCYLPGGNLVGFSRQEVLGYEEKNELCCRAIFYCAEDVSAYWLGLQTVQAAYLAREDIANPDSIDSEKLKNLVQDMIGGSASGFSPNKLNKMLASFSFVAKALDKKLNGLLVPVIKSFSITEDESILDKTKACVDYLLKMLSEASIREEDQILSEVLTLQIVMFVSWPTEMLKTVLSSPSVRANASPYIQNK